MAEPMPEGFFRRIDESDDALFYSFPRFVVHIDDWAIKTIGEIFQQRLPRQAELLDLMSSWRSHLPSGLDPAGVTGLGLNRAEMEDNPALTEIVVHNLNREPRTSFHDAEFDGAIVTVSVQYMTRPVEIFAEVGRVLKPGAPFIVTYSNRMFPTKAVAIWQTLDDFDRSKLVARYFMESGAFEKIDFISRAGPTDPPSDPIWAVVGYRIREALT